MTDRILDTRTYSREINLHLNPKEMIIIEHLLHALICEEDAETNAYGFLASWNTNKGIICVSEDTYCIIPHNWLHANQKVFNPYLKLTDNMVKKVLADKLKEIIEKEMTQKYVIPIYNSLYRKYIGCHGIMSAKNYCKYTKFIEYKTNAHKNEYKNTFTKEFIKTNTKRLKTTVFDNDSIKTIYNTYTKLYSA